MFAEPSGQLLVILLRLDPFEAFIHHEPKEHEVFINPEVVNVVPVFREDVNERVKPKHFSIGLSLVILQLVDNSTHFERNFSLI